MKLTHTQINELQSTAQRLIKRLNVSECAEVRSAASEITTEQGERMQIRISVTRAEFDFSDPHFIDEIEPY